MTTMELFLIVQKKHQQFCHFFCLVLITLINFFLFFICYRFSWLHFKNLLFEGDLYIFKTVRQPEQFATKMVNELQTIKRWSYNSWSRHIDIDPLNCRLKNRIDLLDVDALIDLELNKLTYSFPKTILQSFLELPFMDQAIICWSYLFFFVLLYSIFYTSLNFFLTPKILNKINYN